ncbi:hypothetical protein FAZ15_11580 [Sphingobacterium olei]|uniref:Uncharacterized protein n=1 Tax=Sphingobacterium olei TaxID=2571155 RepID=A0A4U0P0B2_9SPHI|nr:DUF2683 family protein [Sphingobacterium olei]TJZ60626.1 hypothetical protein FAZ15_11580 [Sphingobacterium olei]
MTMIVIHPDNKEQLDAVKAFVKALKIKFETIEKDSYYNLEFVKRVLDAENSAKEGNVTRIKDAKNIWADIL